MRKKYDLRLRATNELYCMVRAEKETDLFLSLLN